MSGETYDDSEIPDLSEIGGHWDNRIVLWHHDGLDRGPVCPGRRIARLPDREWPNDPEKCTAGPTDTTWILDGRVLLCNGCGIDGT